MMSEEDRRKLEDAKKREIMLNDAEKGLGVAEYVNEFQEE
jgi:hypothetical protein